LDLVSKWLWPMIVDLKCVLGVVILDCKRHKIEQINSFRVNDSTHVHLFSFSFLNGTHVHLGDVQNINPQKKGTIKLNELQSKIPTRYSRAWSKISSIVRKYDTFYWLHLHIETVKNQEVFYSILYISKACLSTKKSRNSATNFIFSQVEASACLEN